LHKPHLLEGSSSLRRSRPRWFARRSPGPAARPTTADHAGRAAEEDGERIRVGVGGGQNTLGGEAPWDAAVDEVGVDEVVTVGKRLYLFRVRRVGAGGGIEEVDRAAQRLVVESPQPAEERGDPDAAGDPDLAAGA